MDYKTKPCIYCKQPIVMACVTSTGRWMPVDVQPTPAGNVVLTNTNPPAATVHKNPVPGGRTPHHFTCTELPANKGNNE